MHKELMKMVMRDLSLIIAALVAVVGVGAYVIDMWEKRLPAAVIAILVEKNKNQDMPTGRRRLRNPRTLRPSATSDLLTALNTNRHHRPPIPQGVKKAQDEQHSAIAEESIASEIASLLDGSATTTLASIKRLNKETDLRNGIIKTAKKRKRNKPRNLNSKEMAENMLMCKSYSKKINYKAIEGLFEDD
ncbi:hypothetical protein B9Z19DRAFT_1124777 [Tuber borchii]|uniref:Brf1 TBP-binding domain-containing protein n=1 Tax=Tuber borchii TaxID=42251 RepID=A0A2T6ZW80_TUBBO|nr:hypothetical protein B9Z19DRAFT_1124777 [Tuber borchii]